MKTKLKNGEAGLHSHQDLFELVDRQALSIQSDVHVGFINILQVYLHFELSAKSVCLFGR